MKKRYGLAIVLIALCGLMVFKFINVDPDRKKVLDEIRKNENLSKKEMNEKESPYLRIKNKEYLKELYEVIKKLEVSDAQYIDDNIRPRAMGPVFKVGENMEIWGYNSHIEIILKNHEFKSSKNYVRYKWDDNWSDYLDKILQSPKTKDLDEEVN